MAVVTPLNNPGGPEGDTVTVAEKLLNTEWVGSRSPDGWDQIPYRPGGWVLHQPPWSFGFDSQTRGTRENRRTLC